MNRSLLLALLALAIAPGAAGARVTHDCNFVSIPNSVTFQQVFATNTACHEARVLAKRLFSGKPAIAGWKCRWQGGQANAPYAPLSCRNTNGRRVRTTGAQDAL
jgi:hypothetical protein